MNTCKDCQFRHKAVNDTFLCANINLVDYELNDKHGAVASEEWRNNGF